MHALNNFMLTIDSYLGSAQWFVFLLLGTGVFFTFYLGFPQIRYFAHALRIVRGKYDKEGDTGDTSHFQALTTALSGTVGTGNIAGVAVAIWLGGPAALFWMLVTAFLGMTTKFVEVSLSHKYRDILPDGSVSGGPMYFMKKRLNFTTSLGKTYKTGHILGSVFAVATIFSAFGTGSLPQMKSIADAMESTFGLAPVITGFILAILLGLVIIGGISRIAKVTERLVPAMAFIYLGGALSVIIYNYANIVPSFISIFSHIFSGSAATGGFLGASLAFAFNRGVNRGLFSNEAGQGSAPIAHAAARADEPISEGMVAILEPFIDTIIICTITGLVLLSSGVWTEKHQNIFQTADLEVLSGDLLQDNPTDKERLFNHLANTQPIESYTGVIEVVAGEITNTGFTVMHARSLAENVLVYTADHNLFTGSLSATKGRIDFQANPVTLEGRSLIHSASLTIEAFKRGFLGDWGKYIVSIGLLLFAFSTAISWSYYGDRAVTYLWGTGFVLYYRIVYVIGFFLAALIDTTIVWTFSGITIALMTIPNLLGILILHKDMKNTIAEYWTSFRSNK